MKENKIDNRIEKILEALEGMPVSVVKLLLRKIESELDDNSVVVIKKKEEKKTER